MRVLNGTGRAGLAAGVARTLKARGYEVSDVANAQTGTVTGDVPALVVYGAGRQDRARAVAAQVVGARLKSDARSSDTVDLILGTSHSTLRSSQDAEAHLGQGLPAGCSSPS